MPAQKLALHQVLFGIRNELSLYYVPAEKCTLNHIHQVGSNSSRISSEELNEMNFTTNKTVEKNQ